MITGDGVQIAWRELMGRKRFSYAELTGEVITARKALEYGMVNEIHEDVEACYKRAWEIADLIMHTGTRQTRRLTVQVLRRPWKKDISDELRDSCPIEMWNTVTEQSPHHPIYWEASKAQARATIEAEKEGTSIPAWASSSKRRRSSKASSITDICFFSFAGRTRASDVLPVRLLMQFTQCFMRRICITFFTITILHSAGLLVKMSLEFRPNSSKGEGEHDQSAVLLSICNFPTRRRPAERKRRSAFHRYDVCPAERRS